jgi:hypothetical protein
MESAEQFIRRYGHLMDEGVRSGAVRAEELAAMYAEYCVGSSPAGIFGAQVDAGFETTSSDGVANYKRMGGTAFVVESVAVEPIDELHDMARVGWRFDYIRPADRMSGTIRFENVYFLNRAGTAPQIFAWVTPDEQAALKAHGLAG